MHTWTKLKLTLLLYSICLCSGSPSLALMASETPPNYKKFKKYQLQMFTAKQNDQSILIIKLKDIMHNYYYHIMYFYLLTVFYILNDLKHITHVWD